MNSSVRYRVKEGAGVAGSKSSVQKGSRSAGTNGEDFARAIGTARRIDQLGRIVVPAELRRMIGLRTGDLVDFRFVDGHIAVLKVEAECALCGRSEGLTDWRDKHICRECIRDIRDDSIGKAV